MPLSEETKSIARVLATSLVVGGAVVAAPHVAAPLVAGAIGAAASLSENVLATDIFNFLRRGSGHFGLPKVVGVAIAAVVRSMSGRPENRGITKALVAMARDAPARWERLMASCAPELAALSETEFVTLFTNASPTGQQGTSLDPHLWRSIVRWLDEGHLLPPDAVTQIAGELSSRFERALRDTVTSDTPVGREAQAALNLLFHGDTNAAVKRIERDGAARDGEILKRLDAIRSLSVTVLPEAAGVFDAPAENDFFTGRTDVMEAMRNLLRQGRRVALHGMPGIGKTQTADQYAHRFRADYSYVFWVNSESAQSLLSDYLTIARQVLPATSGEADHETTARDVRNWLNAHPGWLLVLDGADDLDMVRDYLPVGKSGDVILTTLQSSLGGIAHGVEVGDLSNEDGATLLLRRARRIDAGAGLDNAVPEDRDAALALSRRMQGLPLALDQAGAYIEDAGDTPAQFLDLYGRRYADLLAERGSNPTGHPSPVSVTLSLSCGRLERDHPAAAALLRACACLAPVAIPEELFTWNSHVWEGPLEAATSDEIGWRRILRAARSLSLIKYDGRGRLLAVHQVVQLLLKDAMIGDEQCAIAKRLVRAIDGVMVRYGEDVGNGKAQEELVHQRLRLQIAHVGLLVEFYRIYTVEAARIYYNTGLYLEKHGVYAFARDLLSLAVKILEHLGGAEHTALAEPLNQLGMCHYHLRQFDTAEVLYGRAISIAETDVGSEHQSVGIYYDNLMAVYQSMGRREEAARAAEQADAIIGADVRHADIHTAIWMNNRATLLIQAGEPAEAEELLLKAVGVVEVELGSEHHELALPLQNLAGIYEERGESERAESLLLKCLSLKEAFFGPDSAQLVGILNRLGDLCVRQRKHSEAEPFYVRSLTICSATAGAGPADVVQALNNLAVLYQSQGRHTEAEPLLALALSLRQQGLGADHLETAQSYKNLGVSYYFLGRYSEAESLYQKALAIREREYGPESLSVDMVLAEYITLLQSVGRQEEAERMADRSDAIRVKLDQAGPGLDAEWPRSEN